MSTDLLTKYETLFGTIPLSDDASQVVLAVFKLIPGIISDVTASSSTSKSDLIKQIVEAGLLTLKNRAIAAGQTDIENWETKINNYVLALLSNELTKLEASAETQVQSKLSTWFKCCSTATA